MSWRARLGYIAAVLVVVLTATSPARGAAGSTDNFWVHCPYAGMSGAFNPIQGTGANWDSWDFFGNTTVTATSTPASLQAAGPGATSCSTATDTASYFAPELSVSGAVVQANGPAPCFQTAAGVTACHFSNIRAYYGTSGARAVEVPNPAGEQVMGGNPDAAAVQPVNVISWSCGGSTPFETHPYTCTNEDLSSDQDGVVLRVIMPRCWDGSGTLPADFAYPKTGTGTGSCPAGFGKVTPLVNVRFHTGILNPCAPAKCAAGNTQTPGFGFVDDHGGAIPWYDGAGGFIDAWQPGDGGLVDLETDCLIHALACPVNPHTSPKSNMPT